MAFTGVDHGGEAESDPDLKSDSGWCAVGLHDLIEVKGGTWRMIRGCFLFLCIAGQRSDLTNPLERFDSGRAGRK